MDTSRIATVVDAARLASRCVALVGCGGSHHLATSLARSGVGRFVLFDGDVVESTNLCRTDFLPSDIGRPKVHALGRRLQELDAAVECVPEDFSDETAERLPAVDLIIAATDSFAGQAAVNRWAVQHRTPALFVGLGAAGLGGEIVFWQAGLPCYRCLVGERYRQPAGGEAVPRLSSQGTTLFDLTWLDAIAGHLALGLLMRGTAHRFGRLLATLGDRNYLRLKIDPDYTQAGQDLVGRELGIPAGQAHFAGWCVSVQRDPAGGQPPCPDCASAGHRADPESKGSLFAVPMSRQDVDKTTAGRDP